MHYAGSTNEITMGGHVSGSPRIVRSTRNGRDYCNFTVVCTAGFRITCTTSNKRIFKIARLMSDGRGVLVSGKLLYLNRVPCIALKSLDVLEESDFPKS